MENGKKHLAARVVTKSLPLKATLLNIVNWLIVKEIYLVLILVMSAILVATMLLISEYIYEFILAKNLLFVIVVATVLQRIRIWQDISANHASIFMNVQNVWGYSTFYNSFNITGKKQGVTPFAFHTIDFSKLKISLNPHLFALLTRFSTLVIILAHLIWILGIFYSLGKELDKKFSFPFFLW